MSSDPTATAAPWWKRLWWRIDAWLIETQHLCEMDDRREVILAAPTPGVTVEYTYQVVADGDILNDFTKMDDALKYAVGLNADWRRVEIVRITWEHIRVR